MGLSAGVIVTDLFAILAAAAGFHLAFRQRRVRALWARLFPGPPRAVRPAGEDPVQSALVIAGTMLMAFGLLIFAFTTVYALLTAAPAG